MLKLTHLAFTVAIGAVAAAAAAQTDPIGASQIKPIAAPPAATMPAAEPQTLEPRPFVAPVINVAWNRAAARELLSYIERVGEEGLEPAKYEPARLRAAIDGSDDAQLSSVATELFLRLSSDLSLGQVRGDARVAWHINDPDMNGNEQYAMMERAVQNQSVRDTLNALHPTHPQYHELKAVLAATPKTEKATVDAIRTNLDRWRWLPRDLGQKYVLVNVPAYMVALVEDGRVLARRRAVAGAVKTATPQLSATISGVIFNPWWEVPASIAPEVRGKKGYVSVPNGEGGVRYRQPPGPSNSLGRMKLVMPNPHAIFLHDTNAKGLFDKQQRAYSHGCIRTEDALGFAQVLLESTGAWDKAAIGKAIATGKPVQANLDAPIPVYITYFTAAAVADKKQIVRYDDIYGRDKPVVTALNGSGAAKTKMASASD